MPEIIILRPHHIDRLVSYSINRNLFDVPCPVTGQTVKERYGKEFYKKFKYLFDFIISGGTGEEFILLRNGLDSVCNSLYPKKCPRETESCSYRDSLDLWNGSGFFINQMDLKEGHLYQLKNFLGRLRKS
jgi:hypothetical protein